MWMPLIWSRCAVRGERAGHQVSWNGPPTVVWAGRSRSGEERRKRGGGGDRARPFADRGR